MDSNNYTSNSNHLDPNISTNPKDVGQWEMIRDVKFEGSPTHVALLHTNKIFAYGGSSLDESKLQNPPPAEILNLETLKVSRLSMDEVKGDLWCGGHTFLEDGRLLMVGGTHYYPKRLGLFGGLNQAYTLEPDTEKWTRLNNMQIGRWYPTLLRLADNSVLTIGGLKDKFPEFWVRLQEVYQADQSWYPMQHRKLFPLYPRLHLLPDGDVFYSGVFNTHFFIPRAFPSALWSYQTRRWKPWGGNHIDKRREEGISLMLALRPPEYRAKVLVAGGGEHNKYRLLLDLLNQFGAGKLLARLPHNQALDSVERIDLSQENPTWKRDSTMCSPRIHAVGVLLPDGQVLAVGGMSHHSHYITKEDFEDQDMASKMGVLHAEIYHPEAKTWTWMAPQKRPRLYHSTALLLPDGRVISMGSNPYANIIEKSIEIYSPPYLYRSDRPVIIEYPSQLSYNQTFTLGVNQSRQVSQIVLMRPEVLTHVTNTDQRLLALEFKVLNDEKLEVQGPLKAAHMPQGFSLLFVLNNDSVPSIGKFVKVK